VPRCRLGACGRQAFSWCTAVFTVWHLGTSLTISLQRLTSLHGFVCVPQTDISLLYLAVDSIHTAVGRFRLLVRRSGIRCRVSWEIQRVVLMVLDSFARQSFLVSTNVTSALEVSKNDMRYINSRFIYLLTYGSVAIAAGASANHRALSWADILCLRVKDHFSCELTHCVTTVSRC